MSDSAFERIYAVVKAIPAGRVATYGMVAMLAGNPRWARVVGYALHVNPQPGIIPCHRVVNRFGETAPGFAFGGGDVQRDLLEAEGVVFGADGRIDLSIYGLFAPPKQVDEWRAFPMSFADFTWSVSDNYFYVNRQITSM